MCDYSMEKFDNRPAEPDEILVLSRFRIGSIGLVDFDDIDCAVCLKPGTKLMLSNIPQIFQDQFGAAKTAKVVFGYRPESGPEHDSYRDGVRFRNGVFVLFQNFGVGVSMKVLSIPEVVEDLNDLFDIKHADDAPVRERTLVFA